MLPNTSNYKNIFDYSFYLKNNHTHFLKILWSFQIFNIFKYKKTQKIVFSPHFWTWTISSEKLSKVSNFLRI